MRRLVLLVLLSLPLLAQTPSGIWGERGISRRFAIRGDRLYAADGRGVAVYDIASPAAIRRIDVERSDSETRDVALAGQTDLVAATSKGVDRFHVTGDGRLVRLGTAGIEGGTTRVAASGTRVAAASGRTLFLLERTEDALVVSQQREFAEPIRALAVHGSVVHVAVERTAIFAVSLVNGETIGVALVDAYGLAVAGSTLWAAAGIRGLFAVDLATSAVRGGIGEGRFRFIDVAAAGSRAYALEAPDRVHIVDGSNPAEPKITGVIRDWANVLAASGSLLFLAGAVIDDEGLALETGVPLRVYDAGAPSPAILGEYRDLAGPVSGVWTDGSLAYVIDPPYLRVLDVSRTSLPRELSSVVVPGIQDWIRVRNGLAVNYGRTRVVLIDVSLPRRPKVLGSWDTQGHAPSFAALLRDTFVEANNHSGLHVVDYSEPSRPVQIAGRIFHYLDVTAGDDAIYAVQQNSWLAIDLRDRRTVVDARVHRGQFFQIDTFPPNAPFPHHLALRSAQDIVFYSLQADRFDPRRVGAVSIDDPGIFGTSDDYLVVTSGDVLHRIDLAGLRPSATDMAVTAPMQISIAGQKVVVADRYRLRVYGPDTAPPPAEPVRRRAVGH